MNVALTVCSQNLFQSGFEDKGLNMFNVALTSKLPLVCGGSRQCQSFFLIIFHIFSLFWTYGVIQISVREKRLKKCFGWHRINSGDSHGLFNSSTTQFRYSLWTFFILREAHLRQNVSSRMGGRGLIKVLASDAHREVNVRTLTLECSQMNFSLTREVIVVH